MSILQTLSTTPPPADGWIVLPKNEHQNAIDSISKQAKKYDDQISIDLINLQQGVDQSSPEVKGGYGGWKGGSWTPDTSYLVVKPTKTLEAANAFLKQYRKVRQELVEYSAFLKDNDAVLTTSGMNVQKTQAEVSDALSYYDGHLEILKSLVKELEKKELDPNQKKLVERFWKSVVDVKNQ